MEVGNSVFIDYPAIPVGDVHNKKLLASFRTKFVAPFKVVAKNSAVNSELELPSSFKRSHACFPHLPDLQEFAATNINNTDEFFSSSFIHRSSKKANSERESFQSVNQANQDQIEHIHNNNILVSDISSSPTIDSVPHVPADFTNLPRKSFDSLIDTGSSSCLIGEEIVKTINVPPVLPQDKPLINPITPDFPLEPPPRRPSDYISQLAS
ncbi:unnamed protein product [Ambrosiozyma monospora]|uniref:Unnamed protein product n=1 Tax=Ambrosiozyma monospora TaxID=43982 RepID=A0A9W6Z270_AMBMO|nr:unnamed protein product [Ambrosiozyma monospora]